jgi:twinkle protein
MTRDSKGFEYPILTNTTTDQISEWYRDKAFIYDNNIIDDQELDDLLRIIEKSIMQYGIKMVCIDNLMTALDVAMTDDLYRAQSKFVGKLAKMAKQYDVVIILVAHPRKQSLELTNDDVSGSSDITNKVDVVMNYTTKKDLDESERILTITKNRLTGRITKSGNEIKLYFEENSKRIYSDTGDIRKAYGWEDYKDDGFISVEDMELPFM